MSIYKKYTHDQLNEHFSQYLISSWSFSKVSEFSRNEKAFEMSSIYRCSWKSSPSTVAGEAYHEALEAFFNSFKDGVSLDLVKLEEVAFNFIDEVDANNWKLGKTTPMVEDCRKKALLLTSSLLRNFVSEIGTYLDEIKEVLEVEVYCDDFLTINGVDIPLPCHAKIDLIILTKEDRIAIVDHKSKASFSDEEEMSLMIGRQAITYIKSYEAKSGNIVDQVWFVENKYSQNKDKSPQLNAFKISIDTDTRRLYEALLYEPLRRMIQAVNDPDYVYMINDQDNFVDKAEMYDFWAKTMICEVEDFNVEDSKKALVTKRLKKIRDSSIATINPSLIKKFRENAAQFIQYDLSNKDMSQEEKIEHILRSFGTIVKVAHRFEGYSSNTYLLEVSAGVKITSIHSHKLDIANALDVSTVRISPELVVYENKSYLSVEFSKKRGDTLFWDRSNVTNGKVPIGKDNFDNVIFWDTTNHSTPHVLVCGATGSGKSVLIRSIIESAKLLGFNEIVVLDPKYEFVKLNHSGIRVYNDIIEIEEVMEGLVEDMNARAKQGQQCKTMVVFDEFADALSSSRKGSELDIKEMVQVGHTKVKGMFGDHLEPKMKLQKIGEKKSLEENLRVLLQKGRSIGYRIVAATQRASVKVITGDAKVNFPVQICFRVPKAIDSKVVLDEEGAEGLGGMGDGLIKSPEYKDTVRFQAYYFQDKLE